MSETSVEVAPAVSGGARQLNDYDVTFSVDGNLMVRAESAEHAESRAISALEDLQLYDTEDSTVSGCVVRVALEFIDEGDGDPRCLKVERSSRAVEFTS